MTKYLWEIVDVDGDTHTVVAGNIIMAITYVITHGVKEKYIVSVTRHEPIAGRETWVTEEELEKLVARC